MPIRNRYWPRKRFDRMSNMLMNQKALDEDSDEWKALEGEILGFDVRTIKSRFGDECDQVR